MIEPRFTVVFAKQIDSQVLNTRAWLVRTKDNSDGTTMDCEYSKSSQAEAEQYALKAIEARWGSK